MPAKDDMSLSRLGFSKGVEEKLRAAGVVDVKAFFEKVKTSHGAETLRRQVDADIEAMNDAIDVAIELMPAQKAPEEKTSVSLAKAAEPTLSELLTRRSHPGWKPKIKHLAPAVVAKHFIPKVGERLLIEYTNDPWKDTVCWVVKEVYDTYDKLEGTTCALGHVRLYDPYGTQYGSTNYLDAASRGLTLKIPDASRKWTQGEEHTLMELAKQHRRKKRGQPEPEEKKTPADILVEDQPKKRGRPKGVKNKPTKESKK